MEGMGKYIAIFMLLFITACAGGDNQCLGPKSPDSTASSGTAGKVKSATSAKSLDEFLLKAQIISKVVDKIKEKVIGKDGKWGAAQRTFDGIVKNEYYSTAIGAMFTLALTFYGIGVSTGIIQVTVGDAVIRTMKIAVVATIASNWDFFYQSIASFFILGTDELILHFLEAFKPIYEIQQGQSEGKLLFSDLDKFAAVIFSQHMIAIISALFSVFGTAGSSPYSMVYAALLAFSIFHLLQAILRVVTVYCLSIFAKALLFALAPIFLSFMLFNQTKMMFDSWIKQLVNYSLQPVIVMAFVGMFVALIAPLLTDILQYNVVWAETGSATGGKAWQFTKDCSEIVSFGITSEPAVRLQTLLLLFFFSWLFGAYISIAEQISTSITVSVAGNLSDAAVWASATRGGVAGGALGKGGGTALINKVAPQRGGVGR